MSAALEYDAVARASSRRWRSVEGRVACVVLFLFGLDYTIHAGVTIGISAAAVTMPIWLRCLRRYRLGAPFCALVALAAGWGLVLSRMNDTNHVINASLRRDGTVQMLGLAAAVGVVLWAREHVTDAAIGGYFGTGTLLHALMHPGSWGSNAWKFGLAIPVALVLISLARRSSRTAPSLVMLVFLAAVSIAFDSRAYSAALFLVAVLLIWSSARRSRGRRLPRTWIALLVGGVAVAIYFLATSLLVNGYLGRDAQERSVAQIDTSGSLILGGRPELAATAALMKHNPAGFGVGVVPSPADVLAAKSGLADINYAPNNGYVDRYMFGGHIELHSVIGDMWASWGALGLAIVIVVVFISLRSVSEAVASRTGNSLTLYLCCWTLWNILFSPLVVSLPIVVLAVGLSLRKVRTGR